MGCVQSSTGCYYNTSIVLDLSSCKGFFVFGPDALTIPGPVNLSGINTTLCPLNVNILENCKGDYKITLLDDNGCRLNSIILPCSQYKIELITDALCYSTDYLPIVIGDPSNNFATFLSIPSPAIGLYELYQTNPQKLYLIQIKATNLNLAGKYVDFEESAYYYRRVTQSYQNLWCGAENCDTNIICDIIKNINNIYQTSNVCDISENLELPIVGNTKGTFCYSQEHGSTIVNITRTDVSNISLQVSSYSHLDSIQNRTLYSLTNDFFKMRIQSLKQLCEGPAHCGKVCNDQFFPTHTNPCQAFRGCCPKNY
jgi:hypothetical protein